MGAGANSSAIAALNAHVITGNYAIGGSFNFGTYPGVYDGNIDDTTTLLTDQAFTWAIYNNAGTLQHSIYQQSGAAALGNFQSRINSASAAATNTPTGPDSSTPMAAGGKIGNPTTNDFWFDTNAQVPANFCPTAVVIYNDTGTQITVRPQVASITINGATRFRLLFQFVVAGTGAPFALNTTNIPPGKTIQVQFYGKLS
jgi:hypothetical protein